MYVVKPVPHSITFIADAMSQKEKEPEKIDRN